MPDERTTRRLAAILAADVVGYSRLMAADEAGTLSALKGHREKLFDPAVAAHNGRIVKLIGDGTLVEFASVVDAVKCALAIQGAVRAAAPSGGPAIMLRIGINLGDIIIDGDDIYGDGVNVAARLEPLAEPGGVCVSAIVNESVGTRIDVSFKDGGEVSVKNIDRPIRIWKWHPGSAPAPQRAPLRSEPEAADANPSIAVLPFDNMSGDPEQEYFSDGITEDIITDLSKVGGLLVIARNSSFAYKGKSVDIRNVARDLGVRSVLEGSIRRAGNRVRITAQLIDAGTGGHLWAERYDRDLTDIFAVQDEVTKHIVQALKVTLTPSERARIAEGGTASVEAHDCFLRARRLVQSPNINRQAFEQAIELFNRAIELDPGYAEPYAGLALAYMFDFHNRWTTDPDASLTRADQLAAKAMALDPNEPLAYFAASITAGFLKDQARSEAAIDSALALNPNYALALNARGVFTIYAGQPEAAIPYIERAMRLDPGFSQQYLQFLGLAHFLLGNFETAATMFRERIVLMPETDVSRSMLAATLGHLGEVEEARRVWAELKQVQPRYSFTEHLGRSPFRNPADPKRIVGGLAKAGLPD
ncbi:MAG: adenylate/guanylate cyclase domain-containing protein [Bauldia sp.]